MRLPSILVLAWLAAPAAAQQHRRVRSRAGGVYRGRVRYFRKRAVLSGSYNGAVTGHGHEYEFIRK
jgi:hypothetical protein